MIARLSGFQEIPKEIFEFLVDVFFCSHISIVALFCGFLLANFFLGLFHALVHPFQSFHRVRIRRTVILNGDFSRQQTLLMLHSTRASWWAEFLSLSVFFYSMHFLMSFLVFRFLLLRVKKKSDRKKTKYSFEDRKSLALVCLILDCYFTKKNISVSLKKKHKKNEKDVSHQFSNPQHVLRRPRFWKFFSIFWNFLKFFCFLHPRLDTLGKREPSSADSSSFSSFFF